MTYCCFCIEFVDVLAPSPESGFVDKVVVVSVFVVVLVVVIVVVCVVLVLVPKALQL